MKAGRFSPHFAEEIGIQPPIRGEVNPGKALAKALVPPPVRRLIRGWHRRFVFHRAMKRLIANPAAASSPNSTVMEDLVYGWGNQAWSAQGEYLRACVSHALAAPGPVLECGSGLSTLVLGVIAQRTGQVHLALEHSTAWAAKVRWYLDRYRINAVEVATAALRDYGSFSWYDPPLAAMPERFALVICDGPPGDTKGGRHGLVPVLGDKLRPGCVILVDDGARPAEQTIAARWATQLGARPQTLGQMKPFLKMIVGEAPMPLPDLPRVHRPAAVEAVPAS